MSKEGVKLEFKKTNKFTKKELQLLQQLPYEIKVAKTKLRIRECYEYWNGDIGVNFSGGLDSLVLLHLVRDLYSDVMAISVPTIECKENQDLINKIENVVKLKPIYSMVEVNKKFGIPIGSKKIAKSLRRLQNPTEKNAASRNLALTGITRAGNKCDRYKLPKKWLKLVDSEFKVSEQCCYYMKEKPFMDYSKETGIHYLYGTKASDSQQRESSYLQNGCNSFKGEGKSTPLGFWTDQDILRYIVENNLEFSKAYGSIIKKDGEYETTKASRTGCFMCLFGLHMEKQPNRLQRMQVEEPKKYDFVLNKLGYKDILDFMNISYRIDQIDDYRGILPNQIGFFDAKVV